MKRFPEDSANRFGNDLIYNHCGGETLRFWWQRSNSLAIIIRFARAGFGREFITPSAQNNIVAIKKFTAQRTGRFFWEFCRLNS